MHVLDESYMNRMISQKGADFAAAIGAAFNRYKGWTRANGVDIDAVETTVFKLTHSPKAWAAMRKIVAQRFEEQRKIIFKLDKNEEERKASIRAVFKILHEALQLFTVGKFMTTPKPMLFDLYVLTALDIWLRRANLPGIIPRELFKILEDSQKIRQGFKEFTEYR